MKIYEAIQFVETKLNDKDVSVTSINQAQKLAHDHILPNLPEGKYILVNVGLAIKVQDYN